MQWGEGTLGSLILTCNSLNEENSVVYNVYYGKISDRIREFTPFYNFFLFLGAVIYVALNIKRRDSFVKDTFLLFFIGGFLFSIVWEAKSRYVMPYVICLVPYMAAGAQEIQQKTGALVKKLAYNFNSP